VNGSQGFYDLDSETQRARARVPSFHGLLIRLRSVNARMKKGDARKTSRYRGMRF